ncbi:arylsulfatase [Prevotella sp. CAG:5226]|nr:arylsulfatase [Prevotella sp. CAG:5226]
MKYFIKPIAYLLGIHLAALVLLTLMRVCFYLSVSHMLTPDVAGQPALVATAFVRGLWFDNVIACYIMALPLVVGCVAGAFGLVRKWMLRAAGVWFGVWYTLVFMATAGNIPYFVYFSKVLNASIWNWAGYGGTTLGMIFGEPSYYLYIALFVVATALFSVFLWYMRHRALKHWPEVVPPAAHDLKSVQWWLSAGGKLLVGLALCGACFLGIRGRLGYNPIKVSAAYFCSSPVLNNVGVNPMFCLLNSTLDDLRPENRTLHLMRC